MTIDIKPGKRLYGRLSVPGDKSISHRAVMLGAIARGRTVVRGILDCDDCDRTIEAFRRMGVAMAKEGDRLTVKGSGLRGLRPPAGHLRMGESGTTMRVLAGILSGQPFRAVLEADESLSKRPMKRVIEPLSLMGAGISASRGGYPPLIVEGGHLKPVDYKMRVASAQVKSAVLFAALYADGTTTVEEPRPSRDHTERMMKYFGAKLKTDGSKVSITGGKELTGRTVDIPGDISSASFFMAGAALLTGSRIHIDKVSVNPSRAGILNVMSRMGARIKVTGRVDSFEPYGDIEVVSSPTSGTVIERREIPSIIDELPVIFVLAALSRGRTVIKGAEELRVKETDRIASMVENISRMGGRISEKGGEIVIDGVERLKGARIKSFGDHRTAMSMAVAALTAQGESSIEGAECVNKSFPGFFKTLNSLKR